LGTKEKTIFTTESIEATEVIMKENSHGKEAGNIPKEGNHHLHLPGAAA
jgi:hypothetical protein